MTSNDFRRIALGLEGAIEASHMGHPDFRINGRIFATLRHDNQWGMVVLPPEQQQTFIEENPGTFVAEKGAWGRMGCTTVLLDSVQEDTLGEALTLAWQHIASKGPSRSPSRKRRAKTAPPSSRKKSAKSARPKSKR
ncbi:MAG TPA: MmcQ/YjbR family DNA-binding protein [Vicinamibacterales bacterium]|jgi:hypothetical protein